MRFSIQSIAISNLRVAYYREKGNLSVAPLVFARSTGAIHRVLVGKAFLGMNSGTGGVIL